MVSYRDPIHYYDSIADMYKRARPDYPAPLFEDLAELAPGRGLAWDVGTGSNAAGARGLAKHFARVIATDICPRQVAEADRIPGVEFLEAPADSAPIEDGSVDLITAAHSLHFFADEGFFREAGRVLRPGGLIAAFGYRLPRVDDGPIDAEVDTLFWSPELKGRWHPSRRFVETAYADLPFPFSEVAPPRVYTIRARWDMATFINYLLTWQGVYDAHRGDAAARDVVDGPIRRIIAAWGKVPCRLVLWPLHIRLGRRPEG